MRRRRRETTRDDERRTKILTCKELSLKGESSKKTNNVNYNIKIDINSKYVFEQCFPNKVIIANFRNLTLNFRYLKLI